MNLISLKSYTHPCKCGYYGHPTKPCQCTFQEVKKYRNKISGPILDRIDIHLQVPSVDYKALLKTSDKPQISSAEIKERVLAARKIQERRYGTQLKTNAKLKSKEIKKYCILEPKAQEFLEKAAEKFSFSARAIHKILKIARTIADLEQSEMILKPHITEAIQYRSLEKNLWQE